MEYRSDRKITDRIHNLDVKISNMNPNRRIIYFKSEDRGIIRFAVENSAALKAVSDMRCGLGKERRSSTSQEQSIVCVDLTHIYKNTALGGIIVPGFYDEKKYDDPIRFALITDFQMYEEKHRSYMIKAFLESSEFGKHNTILLISSPEVHIPDVFSSEIELISDIYMTHGDIYGKLSKQVRSEEKDRGITVFGDGELDRLAEDFVGMTDRQVDDILSSMSGVLCRGLVSDDAGDPQDTPVRRRIMQERIKEAEKDSAIRFINLDKKEKVSGLGQYIGWLDERYENFRDPEAAEREGTPAPKGVLLCGVPGTGKTAMARETARRYNVPLIQFDVSRIQTHDFGGSEAKLRRYLERISAFGSCVMLMDEIEKTFSMNESTHEVKKAMIGQLLDWMQTRKSNVFTFITANNISNLPPELLRDGRISGRFFAFMPSRDDLAAILRVKLRPLAENGRINNEFIDILSKSYESNPVSDPVGMIFDRIADEARTAGEQKDNNKDVRIRHPFMTGANLETLVEMTNRRLLTKAKKKERINGVPVSKPYSISVYTEQMCSCAADPSFVPQGQSNMEDIVKMWIDAQKRQYQDVSDNSLLPFSGFSDGKFISVPAAKNAYDRYMTDVIKNRIETLFEPRENVRHAEKSEH